MNYSQSVKDYFLRMRTLNYLLTSSTRFQVTRKFSAPWILHVKKMRRIFLPVITRYSGDLDERYERETELPYCRGKSRSADIHNTRMRVGIQLHKPKE